MQYAKPVTLNVEECDRLSFLPYLFGNDFLYAEAYVYALAQKMMPEYQGGFWHFIRLPDGMTRINVKVKGAKETEINGSGPNITPEAMQALWDNLEELGEGDILVLCRQHSFQHAAGCLPADSGSAGWPRHPLCGGCHP